jgi:hypothetical protein
MERAPAIYPVRMPRNNILMTVQYQVVLVEPQLGPISELTLHIDIQLIMEEEGLLSRMYIMYDVLVHREYPRPFR